MSSLRHITLPGAIILLAALVLSLPSSEAEWLLASLLHLRRRLGGMRLGRGLHVGALRPDRIIHPHGF